MASVPKDVYKTIKRSISATTNGLVNNSQQLFGGGSNLSRLSNTSNGTPTKHWIHPPDILVNGRVEYTAKMWGKIEVSEPKGSHVVRDAIHAIRFQHQLNKSITGHSGAKLRKVDLQISVDGLSIIDSKSRIILHKHPLRRISFCADDKEDKRVFSFIAKTDGAKHECFVFSSEKMAEKITLTIGEAFDLAYERYCRKNGKDLENQKQMILLKKRIVELEAENARLKSQLSGENNEQKNTTAAPLIPNTPIPPVPPVINNLQTASSNNLSTSNIFSNNFQNQQTIALAPPPFQNSRRSNNLVTQTTTGLPVLPEQSTSDVLFSLNDVFNREKQGPDVGRRLQNLQIDKMEDLFDDEFDPRAGEKKSIENENPVSLASNNEKNGIEKNVLPSTNNSSASGQNNVVEDFEALLKRIDERLAEISEGFPGESLERGDTGDSGRDVDNVEDQTNATSTSVNQQQR